MNDQGARQCQQFAAVSGTPRLLLRFEALLLLLLSACAFSVVSGDWAMFFWCFLLPDLSMLGYVAGARVGALCYNTAHSSLLPLAWIGVAHWQLQPLWQALSLIWLAHIGFDRALGYGLKYRQGFRFTHLGIVGRAGASRHNNQSTI